jgi:protein-S-isoprenylcysteine O-methyltransferase Ste14
MTPVDQVRKQEIDRGIRKRLVQLGIQALILAAILFISAGGLAWVWGWVYLATFVLGVGTLGVVLYSKNPELIAERARQAAEGTKGWDRALTVIYGLLSAIGLQLVAGLDYRFGWSPPLPLWVHLGGLVLTLLGYAFASWAMVENTYFACTVRIQDERGHAVCTSGPYQYVRHPGYSGWGLGLLSAPLLLGSLYALIPGALALLLLIIRTALEDRTLQGELQGYGEYTQQVRFRLLPGIW